MRFHEVEGERELILDAVEEILVLHVDERLLGVRLEVAHEIELDFGFGGGPPLDGRSVCRISISDNARGGPARMDRRRSGIGTTPRTRTGRSPR
jgi:hypothetical protein